MIPAQLIRSLGQPCKLAGLERAHAEAVAVGDDAPIEVAIDLVDALLEVLERQLPRPPERQADDPRERRPRTARTGRYLVQVRELAGAGQSDGQIAEALGMSADAVRALRRRYAISPGHAPNTGPSRSGWEVALREARGRGLTNAQIAEELGWTPRTVQQRMHVLGLRSVRS